MKMLIVTAAILIGGAAFPAAANSRQADLESIVVRSVDLDLGTERGVRELSRRIAQASWRICGEPALRTVSDKVAERACMGQAAGSAEKSRSIAIAQAQRAKRGGTELANMVPLKSR